jgi:GTP-binding protein YchF
MKAALIGMPYSGKSLVFEALTSVPQGKKEENIGSIKVPDERIEYLVKIYNPKKTTLAEFVISDYLATPEKDVIISSKIKNLIQKADTLVLVLRNFDSQLSGEEKNPLIEYKKIKEDIILTDMIVLEKRIERENKEKKNPVEMNVLKRLNKMLETFSFPDMNDFSNDDLAKIANYNFLSLKKIVILVNQTEGENIIPQDLIDELSKDKLHGFPISATLENELNKISEEEQQGFLESFGLTEPASDRFVKHVYNELGLISFLTSGEDEVRAWPIKKGMTASQAAGKIHSDIEKGFIRAEVISFDDFKIYNSEAECKKAGKYRLEGKEYVVKDGDIINFRFNV